MILLKVRFSQDRASKKKDYVIPDTCTNSILENNIVKGIFMRKYKSELKVQQAKYIAFPCPTDGKKSHNGNEEQQLDKSTRYYLACF